MLLLNLVFVFLFMHYGNGVVIYGVVVGSIMYGYRVILVGSDGAFMSSISTIHAI